MQYESPAQYRSGTPLIAVHDAAAALDFYQRAFGATVGTRLDAPDGRVMHAALHVDGSAIVVVDEIPKSGSDRRTTMEAHRFRSSWPVRTPTPRTLARWQRAHSRSPRSKLISAAVGTAWCGAPSGTAGYCPLARKTFRQTRSTSASAAGSQQANRSISSRNHASPIPQEWAATSAHTALHPCRSTLPADQRHRGKGVVLPDHAGGLFRVAGNG